MSGQQQTAKGLEAHAPNQSQQNNRAFRFRHEVGAMRAADQVDALRPSRPLQLRDVATRTPAESAPIQMTGGQDTRPLRERAREHILANVLSRADGARLAAVFESFFGQPPDAVLVVGSHAELEHTDGSDIDVIFVTRIPDVDKSEGRGFEFFRRVNPGRVPEGVTGIGPGDTQRWISSEAGDIPKAGTVDPFFRAAGSYDDTDERPAIQIWP